MLNTLKRVPGLQGLGAAALSATFLVGCQGSGSFAKLQESLQQINDNQQAILARLDALEEAVKKGGVGRPAPGGKDRGKAGPKPGRPDPSKTYKVAVWDDDAMKGPKDAKVTIVEWSDFQ